MPSMLGLEMIIHYSPDNFIRYEIGNCIELMKEIEDNTIDLVVTSPPYNVRKDYGENYNDEKDWSEYWAWSREWCSEILRILKPDGRFALNVLFSAVVKEKTVNPCFQFHKVLEEVGFDIHGTALWMNNHRTKLTGWGSWLSPSCPYIYPSIETIIMAFKKEWHKQSKGKSTIGTDEFVESVSGLWKIHPQTKNIGHPAPFPIGLPLRCINMLTFEGDTVLDPFLGSGTTLMACRLSNRNGIGFELNPKYEKIIKKRAKTTTLTLEVFDKKKIKGPF